MEYLKCYLPLILIMLCFNLNAQQEKKIDGPVIKGYGATWTIENTDLAIDSSEEFHMVFDIYQKDENPTAVNTSINTLARFLNMHINSGVSREKIKVVAVVHGKAANDIMSNQYYFNKYRVDNPNIELIEFLNDAGVSFYLCGQTMHSRKLTRSELLPEIKVALSAMTAIAYYVNRDYVLIKF